MNITLDSDHIYHDAGGREIPGVTGVLKAAGLIDDRFFDPYSRERGTLVHQATAMLDRDDLDRGALDPVLEPYVVGWELFKSETGFEPLSIEEIVFNERYNYAGTLDRTGIMGNNFWLIDIKSGVAQPWTAFQTAAYAGCAPFPIHRRASVGLTNKGEYKFEEYKDRTDFNAFLACLTVANLQRRMR